MLSALNRFGGKGFLVATATVAATFTFSGLAHASSVSEVFLPRYQADQLAADEPFSDLAVRSDTTVGNQVFGEVWLAGRTSLWRWNIGDQSVRRYRLIDAQENSGRTPVKDAPRLDRILVEVSGGLLVASGDGLFEVEPESGRILRYPLPERLQRPVTTGLFGFGDRIVWTTRGHWIHLDRYGKRLQSLPLPSAAEGADKVLWSPMSRSLWLARGQTLSNTPVVAPTKKDEASGAAGVPRVPAARQVWLAQSPLLGVAQGKGSVLAWTGSSVARFHDSGDFRALETIPVAAPRKLSLISVGLSSHAYLFSDGTLEVYDLMQRQRSSYQIPLPVGPGLAATSRFVLSGPSGQTQMVAIIGGKPRAFSLAKDLSLSSDPTKLDK
ncbi:MAG: hypothetical protein RIQ81_103 [Pseudomonadota bacterium]